MSPALRGGDTKSPLWKKEKTWMCEHGFSAITDIEVRNRKKLTKTPEEDIGIALLTINSQIPQLCKNRLCQISH